MSNLTIVPLSSALGAQISGVDISQTLNLEQRDAIEQAMLKHQVLFFRDQPSRSNRRVLQPVSATCTYIRSTRTCRNSRKC